MGSLQEKSLEEVVHWHHRNEFVVVVEVAVVVLEVVDLVVVVDYSNYDSLKTVDQDARLVVDDEVVMERA